jgi:membrane protein implicated in regulation of membrane protease activity
VHHLHRLSLVITLLGAAALLAGALGPLSPVWTLVGLMLIVAGVVKLVVVYLWRNVAQLDDPIRGDEL